MYVSFFFSLIFLLGTAFINCFNSALRLLYHKDPKLNFLGKQFYYGPLQRFFFPNQRYEGFLLSIISALNITRFFFGFSVLYFLMTTELWKQERIGSQSPPLYDFTLIWIVLSIVTFIVLSFIFAEVAPKLIGTKFPKRSVKFTSPVVSFFLIVAFPITFPILKLSQKYFPKGFLDHLLGPLTPAKQEIMELIQKSNISPEIHPHERELIESVLTFKDRIVREIMVPRVDVFSLPAETSIREASKMIEEEGFSRVPVHRGNVDNIIGVLMYKDIVNKYMEYEENGNDPSILDAPIESIMKNILYTPETKKISNLLQEFLKMTVHFAIVVDEYGGTEGIVTIEDILEEIVGEIADEYDEVEELFTPESDGSWVVDARMSILDVEEQIGIAIPQEGDYDTVGGYIFHAAGAIPEKGFVIHGQEFEIEILDSSERSVDKVKIKPVTSKTEHENSNN